MSHLRARDRDALLLRFYQQKSLAEVGAALGVSEGAAKIRIVRAIEKLRAHLRRRGITVPTEALSAGLLAHATHAAPANVAVGCVPASASSNAAVISKGVSTMMITAKIKIAALLIVIGAIPVGTGAFLLADRPVPATQPAAAAIAAAPTVPDESPVLDPRIAPFVTNSIDIIIAIDLTKLDLDALAADMRTELGQMQMDCALGGARQWDDSDGSERRPTMDRRFQTSGRYEPVSPQPLRRIEGRYLVGHADHETDGDPRLPN